MLNDSFRVVSLLEAGSEGRGDYEPQFYVLGDTYYSNSCTDEVALQHINSDAIFHYGPATLSQTSFLPVRYVFGKSVIDIPDCFLGLEALVKSCPDSTCNVVVALYDVQYHWKIEDLKSLWLEYLSNHPNLTCEVVFGVTPVRSFGNDSDDPLLGDLNVESSATTFVLGVNI